MTSYYFLNHLLIAKQDYEGFLLKKEWSNTDLFVLEKNPDAISVRHWVEIVGGPYGWPDREQYTLAEIEKILQKPEVRMFLLHKNDEPIGYCLTHEERWNDLNPYLTTVNSHGSPSKITRIEGFGLINNQTNKGYGNFFLQYIFRILFYLGDATHIYLTSRGTNHKGVVPFYLRNGLQLIGEEKKVEDRSIIYDEKDEIKNTVTNT